MRFIKNSPIGKIPFGDFYLNAVVCCVRLINMKIVLASSNKHKVQEINEIAASFGVPVRFILPPEGFDPIEDGKTFQENSYIKAYAAWVLSKTWTLADDSGLCIKSLNGAPGIYSARYAETPEPALCAEDIHSYARKRRLLQFPPHPHPLSC